MASVPGLRGELIRGQDFQLVGFTVPTIEVIAAPPFGRDFHVGGTLPAGITVEAGVPNHGVQQRSRIELIGIGEADGYSASAIVRGRGLRIRALMLAKSSSRGKTLTLKFSTCRGESIS